MTRIIRIRPESRGPQGALGGLKRALSSSTFHEVQDTNYKNTRQQHIPGKNWRKYYKYRQFVKGLYFLGDPVRIAYSYRIEICALTHGNFIVFYQK